MRSLRPLYTFCAVAGAVFALSSVSPSVAQITAYSDRSSFLAATTGTTNIDFEGVPAGGFAFHGSGPLVLSGVSFTSNDAMFTIDPGFYGSTYPSDFLNWDYSNPNVLTATLPAGITAVGADIGGLFGQGQDFSITLSTGDVFALFAPGSTDTGALGFAGYTSGSADITSITFSTPDAPGYNMMDNFVFGKKLEAVPEPSSIALLSGGLVPFALYLKRRKA